MSEYWKSTPKYWCKHCKTYVRDTKLERTSHEATPKHQGNLKRFLRDLHRGHEREEREKQRAKNEVERLNGVVSGAPPLSGTFAAPWTRKSAPQTLPDPKQASLIERKQQLAQLADLGVAIPDEFRREMAMAGDWQTLSETPIYERGIKKEEEVDVKPGMLSTGVHKRRRNGNEDMEEEAESERVAREAWGSTFRIYTEAAPDGGEDLNTLLANSRVIGKGKGRAGGVGEAFQGVSVAPGPGTVPKSAQDLLPLEGIAVKREDSCEGAANILDASQMNAATNAIKQKEGGAGSGVIFKKRKIKPIRQR